MQSYKQIRSNWHHQKLENNNHMELRKKMGFDKLHLTTALETIDNLFVYVPGSKNGW